MVENPIIVLNCKNPGSFTKYLSYRHETLLFNNLLIPIATSDTEVYFRVAYIYL